MTETMFPRGEPARDPITGLPDVEAARARLAEWAGGDDVSGPVHAILLGLERFDAVNLAYGATAGDIALAEVASRLSHFAAAELDGPFIVARSGGSHFLIAAAEPFSRERWQLFAEQVADAVARPVTVPGGVLRLSPRGALLRGLPAALVLEPRAEVFDADRFVLPEHRHRPPRRRIRPPGRRHVDARDRRIGALHEVLLDADERERDDQQPEDHGGDPAGGLVSECLQHGVADV